MIVYVASHGQGGRLAPSRRNGRANLAPIAHDMHSGVECVWLGACDVGASKALPRFLSRSGAVLAGGYRCAVNWDASLILDLAVLQELLQVGPIKTRARAVAVLKKALRGFDARWIVGGDIKNRPVQLRDALRVLARNIARGMRARPKDISGELLTALHWQR